jgi:hypothetical protein
MDPKTAGCEAVDYCARLNGGCPRNAACHMVEPGAHTCECRAGFYAVKNSRYSVGPRALDRCVDARVDLLATQKLSTRVVETLVRAAAPHVARAVDKAQLAVASVRLVSVPEPQCGSYGKRMTLVAEVASAGDDGSSVMALSATVIADALNTLVKVDNATVAMATAGIPVYGAHTYDNSPCTDAGVALAARGQGGNEGRLDGLGIGSIVIGTVAVVMLIVAAIYFAQRKARGKFVYLGVWVWGPGCNGSEVPCRAPASV